MPVETILKLKQGDHLIFKMVYEEWSRKVFHYYLGKSDNEEVSKELTQLVFIKFWNYRDSLSTEHSLDQQLFQKARLIYIDWLRAEATRRKYFTTEIPSETPNAGSPLNVELEIREELEYSMNKLSPKRRKVFELKHIHGFSYKEIADSLGIKAKTVDNHLLKASSQLRKVFNL